MRFVRPISRGLLAAAAATLILASPAVRGDEPARATEKAPAKYEVEEHLNLTYFDGDEADAVRHKLDLFLPKGKKDYPVLVFLHGGAWMFGDKSTFNMYSSVGRFLAENGIGVVLPNYRLSPKVKHPEHIKDVARAFAWAHENIAKYGGDPDQMFVGGHSAGGHLSALLATDETYLKAEGLALKNIRGVVAVSGVYRIPDKVEWKVSSSEDSAGGKVSLGGLNPFDLVFSKDTKERENASPVCHVCAGLPPFLLVNADRDYLMLPEMAEELAGKLKDKKVPVESLRVEGRTHMTVISRATSKDDPVGKAMLEFVNKNSTKK
jgi:acetyl esterase/lipase